MEQRPSRLERINEQLDHLAAAQLKSGKDVSQLKRHVAEVLAQLQEQWDCLQALRRELAEEDEDEETR